MTQRGKVTRFYRGARQHPKWDMGTPPNPRSKTPLRKAVRGRALHWTIATLLTITVVPVAIDGASLLWRKSEGCRVWAVLDGNTVRMSCPDIGNVNGRILGFDAPAMKAQCVGEFGKAVVAKAYLHWQVWNGREMSARLRGRDRYDRRQAVMTIDGESVGSRMVDAGLARWYDDGPRRGWCGPQGS